VRRRAVGRIAETLLGALAVFLAAALCSFLTIYRPVLRIIYDSLAAYLAFLADLGSSWANVGPAVLDDYRASMIVLTAALLLALALGVPLGLVAGVSPSSPAGAAARLVSAAGSMTPAFLLAVLIMIFFVLVVLPATGVRFILISGDAPVIDPRRILPIALTLVARPLALVTATTAAAATEVLRADYMRTARSKGLSERRSLVRHALPNIAPTVVDTLPGALLAMLSSLPIVEFVFNWPGVGQELLYRIVAAQDGSARNAALVAFLLASLGITYLAVVALADIVRRACDPRVTELDDLHRSSAA
jgi:peptide/nickel transport system permease protein